jgi:diguanylate cyclase (GGDEF)-like protein
VVVCFGPDASTLPSYVPPSVRRHSHPVNTMRIHSTSLVVAKDGQHSWLFNWKQSAQVRALGFVVLVCIALIGMTAWSIWKAHDEQLRESTTTTRNMAGFLAQHASDTFRSADTVLLGLVERIEYDGLAAPALPRLHQWLQNRASQLTMLNGIFVYDEHGAWIVTSQDAVLKNFNNADRAYFQFHKTNPDQGSHISAPILSRSTQKWVIPVSRRFNHPDGTFAGVVLTTIEMDYFLKFYSSFDIGETGSIVLASEQGTILIRRPFDRKTVGKKLTGSSILARLRTEGPSTRMLTSRVDGVERLYSYRNVVHYPLAVATALSKNDILRDWWQAAFRSAMVTVLLLVVLGTVGWRLVCQIGLRERIERELRDTKMELEESNRSLQILSLEDSLTGLGNRRQFDLSLTHAYRSGYRNHSTMALIMIDVDHFKKFNDLYGHPVGGECLRKIGRVLKNTLGRPNDVAMRYGGEEFAVVLYDTNAVGVQIVAERIRATIEALAIPHTGNPVGCVTISLGVATCVPHDRDSGTAALVKAADYALYAAKACGRNRVQAEVLVDVM